jgi:hypothetical protein
MRRISVRGTSTFSAATLGVIVLTLSTTAVGAPQAPDAVNESISPAAAAQVAANRELAARHRAVLAHAEQLKASKKAAHRRALHRKRVAANSRQASQRRQVAVRASRAAARPGSNRALGRRMAAARGWGDNQFVCLDRLWTAESGWSTSAHNASGAHGIPQAKPGGRMSSAGPDWATNPRTQIAWGLSYIAGRYGTPCVAYSSFQNKNWY